MEESDSPPVAEIAEVDSDLEPTDRSEVSRDPALGKALITDTTLMTIMTIQGSRAKGQSGMGESGERSKDKTPSLPETRASRVTFENPPEKITLHLGPLYIRAHIDGKPVSSVLVDNGATVASPRHALLPLRAIVATVYYRGDRCSLGS